MGNNSTLVAEEKFSLEMAMQELSDWALAKKSKTEVGDDQQSLFEAIQEGRLVLKSDGSAVYRLREPLMGENSTSEKEHIHLDELTFKARIKYKNVKNILRNIRPDDAMGQSIGYLAALTGQPISILEELDMRDVGSLQLLAVFFIT